MCLQCERAYCEEVCPTSALAKNPETGVVDLERRNVLGVSSVSLLVRGNCHPS